MPKMIKNNQIVDDQWLLLPKDATDIPDGPIIVPLELWKAKLTLLSGRDQLGVWLDSDQPPSEIAEQLGNFVVIAIHFPVFTDGRGFSYARELREQHHYAGEVRAVGGFMRDQLFYLKRCGFDAFVLPEPQLESALQSLNDFSDAYQSGVDQPTPMFRRR